MRIADVGARIGIVSLLLGTAFCAAPAVDYDAAVGEARQQLQAGDPQAAWELATRARTADELRPEAYLVLVRLARENERCSEALPLFDRRVRLGGADVAQYHYFLGLIQKDCDLRARSEENLRRAIELEPRSAAAYVELSGLLGSAGRFDEAIALIRDAAPRFTDRPQLLTRLGQLLVKQQRWDEAAEVLGEAAARHPDHARARFLHGLVLIQAGRLTQARTELESAVEIKPDYAVGWYQLAYVYDRLGENALRQQALSRFAAAYAEHGATI